MSNLAMQGGATGSGTVTLLAPVTNTNRTINLPDSNGTIVTTASTAVVTPAMLTQPFTSGTAVASTSGTSIDFTSLPNWVKRITVMLNGVSTNGSSVIEFRLGTSSGVEATGYNAGIGLVSTTNNTTRGLASSTGIPIVHGGAAGDAFYGAIIFSSMGSNIWVGSGTFWNVTLASSFLSGGKTLSGTLDRVRVTTQNGTDAFDAGSINILYEG